MIWFFEWLERDSGNDILFFSCVLSFLAAALLFSCDCGEFTKRDAIEHNAAQWVIVDPATGATEFRWNDELTTGGMAR